MMEMTKHWVVESILAIVAVVSFFLHVHTAHILADIEQKLADNDIHAQGEAITRLERRLSDTLVEFERIKKEQDKISSSTKALSDEVFSIPLW